MDRHYQKPSTDHCVIKYIHIKHSVFDDIGQTVVELAKNWLSFNHLQPKSKFLY
jgi:hypothetical protein